jgi:hypothetical protein
MLNPHGEALGDVDRTEVEEAARSVVREGLPDLPSSDA